MKNILWIISIGCMIMLSWSAYPEIVKVRVVKPKKSKSEQEKKRIEKKSKDVESEYELVDSDKTEVASK